MNMHLALFGTPGPLEILVVLFVILLLFGARRLPDLARSLGRSLSEFRKGREEGLRPAEREPGSDAERAELPDGQAGKSDKAQPR